MDVVVIAGEESGDILGADFIRAYQQRYPNAQFHGIGGRRMAEAGMNCWHPVSVLSVMGLVEVIKHLPRLLKLRKGLLEKIQHLKPAFVMGIDAPDFNLGLEKRVRAMGIKTVHYVSPSVWAWRENRIHGIKKSVDLMLTLFPFEQSFYQRYGVRVECVGHPLADQIDTLNMDKQTNKRDIGLNPDDTVVALLPGSRMSELSRLGELFADVAKRTAERFPHLQWVSATPNSSIEAVWIQYLQQKGIKVRMFPDQSREVILAADFALVASGTVTLECLLAKTPHVMAYKVSPFTYWIAKLFKLVKIKLFALPNLLAGDEIVPEFIQNDATAKNLSKALADLIEEGGTKQVNSFEALAKPLKRDAGKLATDAIGKYLLCN